MTQLTAQDGLQNVVANIGTARDKASHSTYVLDYLDDHTAMTMYRSAWLPKKLIDIPADDAVREWREWMADKADIAKLEKEEQRHGIQSKVRQAIKMSRLVGGSAILIGTGEAEEVLRNPMDPSKIKAGGLKYVTVLGKNDLQPGMIEYSVASEYFGKPKDWQISTDAGTIVTVHPSRLCFLNGREIPQSGASTTEFWGDSYLQAAVEIIKHHDSTIANVASLIFEAKIDVIKVPDLMATLKDGGVQAEQQFLNRFALASTGKGINGTLILDALEEYTQKSTSFASLPDIIDRFIQEICGAFDIPATRLFGKAPGGLNSSGENDLRNYYDMVKTIQTLDIGPALYPLDQAIKASAGVSNGDAWYQWSPLLQTSTEDNAKIGKMIAETGKILIEADLVAPDALAKAIPNALVESGVMPGLEAAIEEVGEFEAGSEDPDEFTNAEDYAPRLIVDNDPLADLADELERAIG